MMLKNVLSRLDASDLYIALVTILPGKVDEKPWDFTDDNGKRREGVSYTQKAKLEVGGFAYPIKIKLEQKADAYAEGEYLMDLASMVTVNKDAVFLSKFHKLIPLKAASLTKVA